MPKKPSPTAHDAGLKQRFGATVRRYRQRLGISQEELAWRAEMHRTYLADVERGVRNLSLSSMARLVGGIGVSLSAFFATFESLDATALGGTSARGARPSGSGTRKSRPTGRAARRT